MDWFEADVDIDGHTAALIARDMRAVAEADGSVHPREVGLIEGFAAAVPSDADATVAVLDSQEVLGVYLRSLILVALADGNISDDEHAAIVGLAGAQGVSVRQVEAAIHDAKLQFIHAFSGVRLFRDAVYDEAERLGLERDEV